MRILHLISSGGMYGAEAVILNLSRTLNEQGHSSIFGIFSNSSNPNLQLHERALAEGIESHLIPCTGQIDRTVPASIRALAATTRADVVHAHGYKADVYAYLAMRKTTTPLVSTCHNWLDNSRSVRLYGAVDRFVLRRYKAIVAVSEEVRQRLIDSGISPVKIHFVRNGIDLRPFAVAVDARRQRQTKEALLRIGWVGRLSGEKGPDVFLRAAQQVRSQFSNARFFLVGDGPDRNEMEQLINELGLRDIAQLLGQRSDMAKAYESFDLMVSSSRREGLPMAILEGMASGLPWVATSVGDVPTVVRNGLTGVTVSPDDANMLAKGIVNMMNNPRLRSDMGVAARRLIEAEYSAERMSEGYLCLYRSLIPL